VIDERKKGFSEVLQVQPTERKEEGWIFMCWFGRVKIERKKENK